jgi:hypothetical protein
MIDAKFVTKCNIALIQEPPIKNGEAVGYPAPLSCLQSDSNPRAIIIHNPSLDIWQIPHLSGRDCQTAIWRNSKNNPIIIISAYWDIKKPQIPHLLTQAVTEAVNKRYDIILGIDSNAHHPAWGSPDANNRGQILEDFITNYNLSILNEGNAPTFYRTNCATHIDITITTNALKTRIRSWSVLDEDMLSDHFCLHTIIDNSTSFKRQILNYKKTDWDQYKDILILEDWSIAKINIPADIDSVVETLST